MLRQMAFSMLAMWLLSGCIALPASVATTSTAVPTPAFLATSTDMQLLTLAPSATPVPSVTPFPPLSSEKPHLMIRQGYLAKTLFIYDQDGRGRQILNLPDDCYVNSGSLKTIISPDGKWLVCYTGFLSSLDSPEELPLTLYIVNLVDGTSRKVADIVTEGYQDKLAKVSDELKSLFPDTYKPLDDSIDWVGGVVTAAFKTQINAAAWSPGSRYLAFAGQMDSNSSDVYVYDVESGSIQRIEDSVQSVSRIQWSPDGKYIVFENSIPGNVYTGLSLYAVKFNDKAVRNSKSLQSGTWWSTKEWLSPTLLLGARGSDTAGEFDLQIIDISSGRIKHLWKDYFNGYAIDYKNKIIAINSSEVATEPDDWGLYYITFDGVRKKIFNGLYWLNLFFRGGEKHRFLVNGSSYQGAQLELGAGDTIGITSNNSSTLLGKFDYQHISISPDYLWLVVYTDKELYLYDKNDELAQTFHLSNIKDVIWRPDSQGIFYSTGKELYSLSLSYEKPVFVDRCMSEHCSFDLRTSNASWIP
jgi:hypothetical protein